MLNNFKKVREFDDNDWDGLAGAEKFEDGSLPVIREATNFMAIGDATGIEIYLEADAENNFNVSIKTSQKVIAAFIENMDANLTEEKLLAMGFKAVY